MASASDQSGTTPKSDLQPAATVQLASSGPPTLVVEAPVSVKAIPPAVKVAPTRDDIALALRSAPETKPQIETQAETVQQPPAAAPPPARRLAADELAALLKRARSLIEVGDIAPARLLLERAAEAQEASAALMLAQTYDPAVLGIQDMRSITPDQAMARDWYQKAARLGSLDAKQRLAQMQN
jgi:TPR repeat protein